LLLSQHLARFIIDYVDSDVVDVFEENGPVGIRHRLLGVLIFMRHLLIHTDDSLACENHGMGGESVHVLDVFRFVVVEIYVVEDF